VVGIVLAVVFVATAVMALRGALGDDAATAASRDRMYICAKTGKPFRHEVKLGDRTPVPSPHSGENTGYPAELCFWTADGGTKTDPTPVLLNEYAGKAGPTYCPDCGRLVTGLNPPPQPGVKAPPKQGESRTVRKEATK
jgi:hypothetical protein